MVVYHEIDLNIGDPLKFDLYRHKPAYFRTAVDPEEGSIRFIWQMKAVSSISVKFTVSASTLHSRPRGDLCEYSTSSGNEMTVYYGHDVSTVYMAMSTSYQCRCSVAARCRPDVDFERLKLWREVDRKDVFKKFERVHGNKFAFLDEGEGKNKDKKNNEQNKLSDIELEIWKEKFTKLKEKDDMKLKLFQKVRNMKQQEIEQMPDLDHRPYLQQLLVAFC